MAASAEMPPRRPPHEPEVAAAPDEPSPLGPRTSGRLRGRIIALSDLTPAQRDTMWRLFATYYEGPGVQRACFDADLNAKQDLILLEDTGALLGLVFALIGDHTERDAADAAHLDPHSHLHPMGRLSLMAARVSTSG